MHVSSGRHSGSIQSNIGGSLVLRDESCMQGISYLRRFLRNQQNTRLVAEDGSRCRIRRVQCISEEEKIKILAQFPSDEELSDENHWYKRACTDVWDDDTAECCDICGFQGHVNPQCPSPRKWRLQMGGEYNK